MTVTPSESHDSSSHRPLRALPTRLLATLLSETQAEIDALEALQEAGSTTITRESWTLSDRTV